MPTLDLRIDAGALGQLTELPEQILAAVATARRALDGADPAGAGNAVADLIAGLDELPGRLAELPDLGPALGQLAGLRDLLPADITAVASDAGDALASVTGMLSSIAPLVQDPGKVITAAVGQLAGVTTTITERSTEARGVTGELQQFFTMLATLDRWSTRPPTAEEVATLIARAFVGADLGLLSAPVAALDGCLARLDIVLPDGEDLTRWRAGRAGLETTWTGIEARLAGPEIDWRAVELDLHAAGRGLDELVAVRDRLLAGAVSALGALNFGALAQVAAALRAVPEIPEVRLTPILDGFVAQMRSLRDGLQNWELSADEVRAIVRGLMLQLREMIEHSALGELRRLVLDFEQRTLALIDGLPLRTIADAMTGALDQVAAAVDDVDLAGLLSPVTELGDTIRAAITGLAGDAVRATVEGVWDSVESALRQAADILDQLRTALAAVTGPLTEFAARVGPTVSAITELTAELRVVIDGFDLAQPTAAVLDNLHRARDTVAAIDVSILPADAVKLVNDAADALADLDIAGTVSGPIVAVLDAIDPEPPLRAAVAVLGDIAGQLGAVDPTQLITTLEEPVGAVLAGLDKLDPSRLQAMVNDAVAPLREAIGVLDATAVLAPATQEFAQLMTRLDGVLDPAPVFEPLQRAYQPVIDAVEALNPAALLDLIAPHIDGATQQFGGAAGGTVSPSALAPGTAFSNLPSIVNADDDLFGFRPGDVLVPLIDLHHRLMTALQDLAADVLDGASGALHAAFGGSLAALHPDAVLNRIDATLARVRSELSATATATTVSGAAVAYQRVAARIAVARGTATGDDVAVTVRINASLPGLDPLRLIPGGGQVNALAAAATVAGRADLAALRSAYAVGVTRLRRLLPAFVGTDAGGTGLLGALRALDPAPIRDQVNALFDEAGQFLAGLDEMVVVAMEEAAAALADLLLPLNPTGLFALVTHVHEGLVAQVEAIAPAALAEHVRLVFAAVRRQLEALDPAQLVRQVDAVRQGLLDALATLIDGLLPDPAPLHALQDRLAQLRPSQLLQPVTAALKPVSELAVAIDADAVVGPLVEGIARIKEQLPVVIAQLEAAFDEVLRAFPKGGVSGASGSVSVSASVG